MWTIEELEFLDEQRKHFGVLRNGKAISFYDALEAMQSDTNLWRRISETLASVPYSAFRFETPGISRGTMMDQKFEFLVVDSPGLDRARPNSSAFHSYLSASCDSVAVFLSLGKDAVLVAPAPIIEDLAYAHIARFVRSAPDSQKEMLWRFVAKAVMKRLDEGKTVWLNTAGGGVPWLHVRIDQRPKYYRGRVFEVTKPKNL